MSLTSELKKRDSAIRALLDEAFTTWKQLTTDWRRRRPGDSESARHHLDQIANPPWSTLGQTIDHRLRFALSNSRAFADPVERGLAAAVRRRLIRRAVADDLRAELGCVIDEYEPSDRSAPLRLPAAAEERLLRLCYVMSGFEAFYRNPTRPAPMLAGDPDTVSLDTMLTEVPDYCVADLLAQVELASGALHELRASTPPSSVCTGPVFAGSADVDGADADLIVDGYLIDVKATVSPSRIGREEFRQLIGYVLLDYENAYDIQQAGFYLSRYGVLIGWDLPRLLQLLGAVEPLAALRQELSARYEPRREARAAAFEASMDRIEAAEGHEIVERIRRSVSPNRPTALDDQV